MDKIPYFLLTRIFEELSLRDAIHASYVSKAWHAVMVQYLYKTFNINRFLGSFTDAKGLLRAFRRSGAILSGSRAVSYFLPWHRLFTSNSDWDIYVPYPNYHIIHQELLAQGYTHLVSTKPQKTPQDFILHNYLNAKSEKVQVVALTPERSLFECLIDFFHSLVQNFISGWGCCSLHWENTFDRRGFLAKRLEEFPEYEELVIEKWAVRKFKLVRWKDREQVNCRFTNVYVMYFPDGERGFGQGYLSLEELERELSLL